VLIRVIIIQAGIPRTGEGIAEAWRGSNHPARVASLTRKIQCVTVAGADGAPRAHGPSHVPDSREEHRDDYCQPDRP
jgi:hypothetical protein